MTRDIPGYYFDKEKNKYFRVQPNHLAPSNAKYAQSNVNREKHLVKRQKRQNDHKRVLKKETVLPAPVFKHSLLGALSREHGFQPPASCFTQREHAFILEMQPYTATVFATVFPKPNMVFDAHWAGIRMVAVFRNALGSCEIRPEDPKYGFGSHPLGPQERQHSRLLVGSGQWLAHASFAGSSIISTCMGTISDMPFVLVCTRRHTDNTSSDVFLELIDGQSQTKGKTMHMHDTVSDCAINNIDNTLAFAGDQKVTTATSSGQIISSLALGTGIFSHKTEWLDAHTLAYDTNKAMMHKKPSKNAVMLWDVRSSTAVAARIKRPKKVTGVSRPDTSGNNLIVTSNYDISLYDLRLLRTDRPLLSIPHVSAGPTTYHATHNRNILAAVDEHQEIQTYSWRTGKWVKTLNAYNPDKALMRNLRWYDGPRGGPSLQACCLNEVLTWEMGGWRMDESR